MDHFREEVVVKHNRIIDDILYVLSWVVLVFSGFMGMIMVSGSLSSIGMGQFDFISLLLGLFFAACCVLLYLFNNRLRTEYEYTFTNGDLDFAQVFNNAKRKSLGGLKVRNIEAFGPVASGAFNRYINMDGVKQRRWFLNRGAELYFFYWVKNGEKNMIIFEPSQEMVKDIRFYLPQNAYQEH